MMAGATRRDSSRWAVLGTMLCVAAVFVDLSRSGGNPVSLIQPGLDGPSAAVVAEDFPAVEPADGLGLDGQQFYAMARDALHPDEAAPALDRPRYRWQRPLLAWLGWALHPTGGGGEGLIWALVAVNAAAVLLGSYATSRLAVRFGGPAWAGLFFAVLPGSWYSLRVTVGDALGLALAVAAVALSASGRHGRAVVAGVAAVLAKEVAVLVLGGWWLARRTRARLLLVVVPAAAAAAWYLVLRSVIPGEEDGVAELAAPFTGWIDAVADRWIHGEELWGMVASVSALVAATAGLVHRGLRHPLAPATLVHLLFTLVCNGDVLGQEFGGTRSTMALLLLGLLLVVTPGDQPVRTDDEPSQGATGMVGPGSAVGASTNS
jgi:hypothetical protein